MLRRVVIPACALFTLLSIAGLADELNYGLQFDSTQCDRVFVSRDASLEPADLTVELWAKELGDSGAYARLVRKKGAYDTGYSLSWGRGGSQHVRCQVEWPSDEVIDPAPNSAYTGSWHHFAAVYSSADQLLTLVVDGAVVDSLHYDGPIIHTSDLHIGCAVFEPWQEGFNGILDEVRIWNIARSPEDIRTTMHRRLTGSEPGLVAYWPFDEGNGQITHDVTSNENHGQLGNSPGIDVQDPEWVIVDGLVPVTMDTWGSIKASYQ